MHGTMLILNDLSVRIAGRLLIEHASVSLPNGTKTGLVGHNGTGKSTLLRVITGELAPETGDIALAKTTRIGQVMQEAPDSEQPLLEIVLAADKERAALMKEAASAADPLRIAEIHARLADIDAHSAERVQAAFFPALALTARHSSGPPQLFPAGGACGLPLPPCFLPNLIFYCWMSRQTIWILKGRYGLLNIFAVIPIL